MAYSDNYPNGYKSGYSSADDPDRKNYNPLYSQGMPEKSSIRSNDDYLKKLRQQEEARARKYYEEVDERKKERARFEKEMEAERLIVAQYRKEYFSKSWFGKLVAKAKGKDFYSMQEEIRNKASEQVNSMSDSELNDFIGRSR